MPEITATAVKSLRDRTDLPMMECKKALQEAGGDEEKAVRILREKGLAKMTERQDRETSEGLVAVFANDKVGAMVEIQCESASVAANDAFQQLAKDLVTQLAQGPGAKTVEELLAQKSPSHPGQTLANQRDELTNKTREVLNTARLVRIDGPTAGYQHHTGNVGVLLEVEGADLDTARDICMHIAAMRPRALRPEDLDKQEVEREREIITETTRKEGKPENIIGKIVDGRMRTYFADNVLVEQPFVKDDSTTVGKHAEKAGLKLKRFVHWRLGQGK